MEWIIGIVVLVIIARIFKPRRCDICGTGFKKEILHLEDRWQKAASLPVLQ